MANLGTFTINTHKEYENLETLLGITLVQDATYSIQPIDCKIFFRRGNEGKGFKIVNNVIFQYIHDISDDIYIQTPHGDCEINIDEQLKKE